jgi:hypothetical protein
LILDGNVEIDPVIHRTRIAQVLQRCRCGWDCPLHLSGRLGTGLDDRSTTTDTAAQTTANPIQISVIHPKVRPLRREVDVDNGA